MTTQHSLIGSMLNHEVYQRLSSHISAEAFDSELKLVYKTLAKAHDEYKRDITLPELRALYLATIPTATKARKENVETLLNRVNESKIYGPDVLADLLNAHYAESVGEQIAEIGMKISENGDDRAELIEAAEKLISDLRVGYKKGTTDEPASWDFDDIQDSLRELEGFRVSIPPLAEVHPNVPRGYFCIFAARPETGKTSFHASLSVGPGGFAYQGARVHVLLNEEKYTRVRNRYATVAVGCDSRTLLENRTEAERILEPLREFVSIHDATGWSIGQVEDHVAKHNPDVVIIDMLDKVGMPGTFNGRHEMLSQLYYRARDLAKITDTTLFGGSQVSADGEHKIRLDMSMLADSKTGKAAEADLVYMIGKGFSNEGVDPMRYINIAKDKAYGLTGTMITAMLDVQTGRYMS